MLITSNTIPPILDANGKPVVNGRLEVRKGSTQTAELAELFYDRELKEAASNPITLNGAGEIPVPVWTETLDVLWCFVFNEDDILVREYPLASVGVPVKDIENIPDEFVTKKLHVINDAIVGRDLDVGDNAIIRRNLFVEKNLIVNDWVRMDKNLLVKENITAKSISINENGPRVEGEEMAISSVSVANSAFNILPNALESEHIPIGSYIIGATIGQEGEELTLNKKVYIDLQQPDNQVIMITSVSYQGNTDLGVYRTLGISGDTSGNAYRFYLCVRVA